MTNLELLLPLLLPLFLPSLIHAGNEFPDQRQDHQRIRNSTRCAR
jgi:hypothetical protein